MRRPVAERLAFKCYLLALALLPFRWLSPIASLQEHGDWTDVFVALAAALWLIDKLRGRALIRSLRIWQLPLVVYLVLAAGSAAVALPGRGGSWKTVVLMVELAVLAVITADFAAEPGRRRLIARVIVATSIGSAVLGVIGLLLFYAGAHSGLVGSYGDLAPSHVYARIQAGFESPQLLASFCIFASGIVASGDAGLNRRFRIATQISLGLLCAATGARGLIGFVLAVMLRASFAMRGRRRTLMPIAAAIASLGIIAVLTAGRFQFDTAKPPVISYAVSGTDNPRRDAFTSSLTTVEHHPVLGVGPGALPGKYQGAPFRAHFTPLNVAATLGLPALCALIAMLWLIWRWRPRPTDLALWTALAGIAIDGLANDIDHYRHVWILLGLLGISQARRRAGRTTSPGPEGPGGPRT
jgi:O-Antigen ligase